MKDDAVAADQGAGVSSADGGCPSMSAPCSPKASKAAGMAAEAATNARRRVQAGAPLLRSTVAAKTAPPAPRASKSVRSEEHTSELQSLMRISYAVFCLKKKKQINKYQYTNTQ